MAFDPHEYLAGLRRVDDSILNPAEAALAFAAVDQPGLSTDRFFHHLSCLAEDVRDAYVRMQAQGEEDCAETMFAALRGVIVEKYGYQGDAETPDDLQNANLIRVIDRRRGLSVALAILYIHAGRAQGWLVEGLDFPGHFVVRIEHKGRRVIFDPSNPARILEAGELRAMLKKLRGTHAELSASYFEPVSNRALLFRLQNTLKFRLIEMEDYEGALKIVEGMRLMDPGEFRLLLDAGVLYARTGQTKTAMDLLEDYIRKAPRAQDRQEAALLLKDLKSPV